MIAMGGPMNVDDVERHPALEAEREWLPEASTREMPVLGICLGAQLLARALGAEVRPGRGAGDRLHHVEVQDPNDPVIGGLAPRAHRPALALRRLRPAGGRASLASSAVTEHQAFRCGNAWGVLFHPEADAALVEAWLKVPEMVMEAGRAIGLGASGLLPSQAEELEPELVGAPPPASAPSPNSSKLAKFGPTWWA